MNENVNKQDKLEIKEQANTPVFVRSVPFEVKVAALNFAVECAKMGICERSVEGMESLANKVVNNYFK